METTSLKNNRFGDGIAKINMWGANDIHEAI